MHVKGCLFGYKGERMLPIVFALIPTIIGSALLIGLVNSGSKGALLFGECNLLYGCCIVTD